MTTISTQTMKSVVPSVAAMVFRTKEKQNYMQPQTCAIASLAIFHMMTSFTRDDVVPALSMIELADKAIAKANSSNNDLKEFHYVDPSINLLGLAKHFSFVTMDEDKCFKMGETWIEMITTKDSAVPFLEPVTEENRRKPYIKGGKVKPSKLAKTAINFLEETTYHVDGQMVKVVKETLELCRFKRQPMPLAIKQEEHVWNASVAMSTQDTLWSEVFDDNRGRMYHVACAGPNPQSSDFARSLYSHNVENFVNKLDDNGSLSPAYVMFMNELADISGGKWLEAKVLTYVAQNPARSLFEMLTTGNAPKKPFTYIRLALDWFAFETTGKCDSRLGFGLDAKCSGTQYLAFIAGDVRMSKATGLVDTAEKSADPYQLSLVELMKFLDKGDKLHLSEEARAEYLNPKAGRNFIKTPYMAVQYGGGKAALTGNKDYVSTIATMYGIQADDLLVEDFAEVSVQAVKDALGEKINLFIAKVAEAVNRKCEELGKEYFTYRHTDGFTVLKPCFPSREVCEAFSIRVDGQTRVIFGQQQDNKPWVIREAQPTREEFVRTFVVNFIQGIDALVARTVAKYAKKAGLRGYTSIHDCFRTCLADAPKLMDAIRLAYVEIFVENDQFENLAKQIGGIDMYHENIVNKELLMSEHAYYFCQ